MKTIEELAQDSIDVQDACNLSGVIHAFARAMSNLRELFPNLGTDLLNRHPISVMYSSKIASLTGSETFTAFSRAYEWAKNPKQDPYQVDNEVDSADIETVPETIRSAS
jgi:hypothetical protein